MQVIKSCWILLVGWAVAGVVVAQHPEFATRPFPVEAPPSVYSLSNAFPGLSFPGIISLHTPPGRTNELFITLKTGTIQVISNLASPTITTFLDIRSRTFLAVECGLTGLAFHPDYDSNRLFYVFYSRTNVAERRVEEVVSRFEADPSNPWRALPLSEQVLLAQPDVNATHQGGDLHFGPDGYLYVSVGDGGGSGATANSQRIDKDFFSGILRLDVDGRPGSLSPNPHPAVGTGYSVPADNPFVGATTFAGVAVTPGAVRTEFWAAGLRNPFRFSFDAYTGEMYVGDVGEVTREEVNRVVAGGNYGWNRREGTVIHSSSPPGVVLNPPLYEYARSGTGSEFTGNCVIGGLVYRGTRHPELFGKYVFGDYMARHIWAMDPATLRITRLLTSDGSPTSFAVHPGTGEILVAERTTSGRISRLVLNGGGGAGTIPLTLGATGIFPDLVQLRPVDGVLPYEINAPFWSDHATKFRWFFLQEPGSTITRDASDRWSIPAGAVFVKHFELERVRGDASTRRRLETRFLIKTADSSYGLTYRWRPDGSDADLVGENGVDEIIPISEGGVLRNQTWHYPGRSECGVCHHSTSGDVLGFDPLQLNRNVVVSGTSINQIVALGNLGVFSPPPVAPELGPRLAPLNDESASVTHRFRSFLEVNCAYCHQPGGIGRGQWDGRLSTPLADAGILNGPVFNDLDIPGARVIVPSDPSASILWRRISESGAWHMPPLATSEINSEAVELVRRFILGDPETPVRTVWKIGTDQLPSTPGYPSSAFSEFSPAVNSDSPPPGAVTRLPGDPAFRPGANPGADDDFYFAGDYPAGFNGLAQPLRVPADEPSQAWERAHTGGDRTNRIHFNLSASQTTPGNRFVLRLDFCNGGSSTSAGRVPGFSQHDLVVRFRNGAGQVTTVGSRTLSAPGVMEVPFDAAAVGAVPGANSIEIVRTGPRVAGTSYWIEYDYVELSVASTLRKSWVIGTDQAPTDPGYPGSAYAEFSIQNLRNDPAPGSVTRLPGDPQFVAGSNPGADDDFYFRGDYSAGFNRLTSSLSVPADEPFTAWERAHSPGDRTNRVHFVLEERHLAPGARLRVRFDICMGRMSVGGVTQPGFSEHVLAVRFRTAAGIVTPLITQTLTQPGVVNVEFSPAAVGAVAGPNTIEVERTGPDASAGTTYWVVYDYLRIDSDAEGGFPIP